MYTSRVDLRVCLLKSTLAIEEYLKSAYSPIRNKRYKAKGKLKSKGFSNEEVNKMFHNELL
jgi:hypothetical protein